MFLNFPQKFELLSTYSYQIYKVVGISNFHSAVKEAETQILVAYLDPSSDELITENLEKILHSFFLVYAKPVITDTN